jgi:hypothetical protein
MSQENVEIVRAASEAINRRDGSADSDGFCLDDPGWGGHRAHLLLPRALALEAVELRE